MDTLDSVSLRCKSKIYPSHRSRPYSDSTLIVNSCLFLLIYIVVVKRQEMVIWVDNNNCKHFPELKTPWGLQVLRKQPYQRNFVDCYHYCRSESGELLINQSCNAIDLAITFNLRNTFPDGFASLVLGF